MDELEKEIKGKLSLTYPEYMPQLAEHIAAGIDIVMRMIMNCHSSVTDEEGAFYLATKIYPELLTNIFKTLDNITKELEK